MDFIQDKLDLLKFLNCSWADTPSNNVFSCFFARANFSKLVRPFYLNVPRGQSSILPFQLISYQFQMIKVEMTLRYFQNRTTFQIPHLTFLPNLT